ncbi:MAG: GLPGLI family protein, partial [Bacteroidota bacterium]|nr:GLPGLI family protein [Bacteroidota bacterium]
MKKSIWNLLICLTASGGINAQAFISQGTIEYVVKSDIKKNMWPGFFTDQLTENLPQLKTGYYLLTFAHNRSIFRFDHWDPNVRYPNFLTSSDEQQIWYSDFNKGTYEMQKNLGNNVVVSDSITPLKWRITNDTRVIAGFSCRKAFTVIFDSVYVFAF